MKGIQQAIHHVLDFESLCSETLLNGLKDKMEYHRVQMINFIKGPLLIFCTVFTDLINNMDTLLYFPFS
jgi:hypothetical protein